tara:strand:- start:443 stop:1291 length:849 start_codon:yes stop_codon:yes gene_type:complete
MNIKRNKNKINESDLKAVENFRELIINIHRLYDDKEGCPWHTSQTHETLFPYLLEESNELMNAFLMNNKKNISEELGDLLLQIMLHSEISSKEEEFELRDVIDLLNKKIISRHPYIFKKKKKISLNEASRIWENQKKLEKINIKQDDLIEKLSLAIQNPDKIQATHSIAFELDQTGLKWNNSNEILQKMIEEIQELKQAIKNKNTQNIQEEFGDIYFTLINLAYILKINHKKALDAANKKFIERISTMEEILDDRITDISMNEFKQLWQQSKEKLQSIKKNE